MLVNGKVYKNINCKGWVVKEKIHLLSCRMSYMLYDLECDAENADGIAESSHKNYIYSKAEFHGICQFFE